MAVFIGISSQPCPSLHKISAPWAISFFLSNFLKICLLEKDQKDLKYLLGANAANATYVNLMKDLYLR